MEAAREAESPGPPRRWGVVVAVAKKLRPVRLRNRFA
jgi:hypothetical protein